MDGRLRRLNAFRVISGGDIFCVINCPYDGTVARQAVIRIAVRFQELGCYEISLGNNVEVGTPGRIVAMIEVVARMRERPPSSVMITIVGILADILAALEIGVAVVERLVAGLGGFPCARGAANRLDCENMV